MHSTPTVAPAILNALAYYGANRITLQATWFTRILASQDEKIAKDMMLPFAETPKAKTSPSALDTRSPARITEEYLPISEHYLYPLSDATGSIELRVYNLCSKRIDTYENVLT